MKNTETWEEYDKRKKWEAVKWLYTAAMVLITISIACAVLFLAEIGNAEVIIDLDAIAMIESSGCINKVSNRPNDRSYGCHQITPILLKEYNQMTKHSYTNGDMMTDALSEQVADWYLHKRIPSMLRYYKMPVTIETVLTSYNMGIGNAVNGKVATNYVAKYLKLVRK
jgi:hypothetical protein